MILKLVLKNAFFESTGDSIIIKEFQRIFAVLDLSDRCAISTKNLTIALQWNQLDFFEDRDIQVYSYLYLL